MLTGHKIDFDGGTFSLLSKNYLGKVRTVISSFLPLFGCSNSGMMRMVGVASTKERNRKKMGGRLWVVSRQKRFPSSRIWEKRGRKEGKSHSSAPASLFCCLPLPPSNSIFPPFLSFSSFFLEYGETCARQKNLNKDAINHDVFFNIAKYGNFKNLPFLFYSL